LDIAMIAMMRFAPTPNRSALLFASPFLALLVLAACGKKEYKELPTRAVKLMAAADHVPDQTRESFSGEVHARIESRLAFRVGGKLVSRAAQLGQSVQAGQVLAQLDPRDYQLGAQAARAQVQAATTARDLAAADLKRFESLRAQGFISGAQLEKYQAQFKANSAQLEQAQAQAAVQNNQADYGQLKADHAGIITAILAEPGQVLGAGQAVVQLAQDGPRDVIFSLPEGAQKSAPLGSVVNISSWTASSAQVQQHWTGHVREVAASADPMTRTFAVKVAIDAAQNQAPSLGSTVHVQLKNAKTQEPAVIELPLSALKREGKNTTVFVYTPTQGQVQGQVHQRVVQTADVDGDAVRIVQGIQPGELVVTAGVHTLTDGQKVQRYEGKPSMDAAANAQGDQ